MCNQTTINQRIAMMQIEMELHQQRAKMAERKIRLLHLHGRATELEATVSFDAVELARLNRNSAACALDIANIELAIARLERQLGVSELEPVPGFDMIDQLLSGAEIMAFAL